MTLHTTTRIAILLATLAATACTDPSIAQRCAPGAGPTMVSAQTPAGVYGMSNPESYYQPANSFPPGVATVDGSCM